MKVSVCITTFNEKKETVDILIRSLNSQSLKPDEIIVIDAKDYGNCSRSQGRNIAINKAKNKIIAITDAGCVPHKDWLKRITEPFLIKNVDVVSGFYNMKYKNNLQKSMQVFLGVKPKDINDNFLPSARSMSFTKEIWKNAGRFPEKLNNTAEDTLFNLNLLKVGAKFKIAPKAIVDWYLPESLIEFVIKIYNYAKGDAQSKIWWHPVKKLKTHNIKILTVYLRYIVFMLLAINNIYLFLIIFTIYSFYSYYKAGLWGIILQILSDFAVIIGFSHGLLQTGI